MKSLKSLQNVIPAPLKVRDKLRLESSNYSMFCLPAGNFGGDAGLSPA